MGVISAAAAVVGGSTLAVAQAAPQLAHDAAQRSADDVSPPYAVETFDYPNAAKILKEQGILLRKGDGHIVLADCRNPDSKDIQVLTSVKHPGQTMQGRYCFKVTGTGKIGYLTLELPQVYNIMTGDVAVQADLTSAGETQSVDVPKNAIKGVGPGANPPAGPTVLVALRVKG
ncbi:hypothetical protein AB0I10_31090 [Streptomyces sp. NPDC050636]|uniref:hypothetical protein n=1 Tax=Streptomyces sp. NPDC050636 TaxID=3154510 RepID=UPI00341B3563